MMSSMCSMPTERRTRLGRQTRLDLCGNRIARAPRVVDAMLSQYLRLLDGVTFETGATCSSSEPLSRCECVVEAGWIASDFASPTFARARSLSELIIFSPAARPPLRPMTTSGTALALQIRLLESVHRVPG